LTSMFFHINIWHFIMNMFILILFGIVLEKNIGSVNFFIVYLVSGLIANFTQAFFLDGGIVIGASGALFGILGSLMMREPLLKVRVFGFFQIPIIVLLGVFFFFVLIQDLWTGFAIHSTFIQGDLAHIIGIFIGILITAIMYKERIFIFYNWLFIISGFWLITLIVKYFISFGFNLSVEMLLYTVLLFVGILIIIYSYLHLKSQEEFKYQK